MRSQLYSTLATHKRTLAALLFGVAFSAVVAYATPPGSPYTAGETLDPACAPGDTNCSVLIIPDQTGNNGEYLTTNGTTLSWATVSGGSSLIGSTSASGSGETWLGYGAGTGGSTTDTVYIGNDAGANATNATNAVFVGGGAGYLATNAQVSNFIGNQAGLSATNAQYSNFIGSQAGKNSTNAQYSNFIGDLAGYAAPNAYRSVFIGKEAGRNTDYATRSIFIGESAGEGSGGDNDYDGDNTSLYFDGIFLGFEAGMNAIDSQGAIFIGASSGKDVTFSTESVFIGTNTGNAATGSELSTFIGANAGNGAINTMAATFIGASAGFNADDASAGTFIGMNAGNGATGAFRANFLGQQAGYGATDAQYSNFIGWTAGQGAENAANAIFIGTGTGFEAGLDNTGDTHDYSILIGNGAKTAGFSNSIALGEVATNTASNQFMIGSSTRPIDSTRINGSAATQCTITTGTGISCTSDERLKTNIETLDDDTLDKIRNVDTVTFNWAATPESNSQIGFIAQNLEQYFPQLVATDSDGYKSVYYAQMTPILVKAIQELDVKVDALAGVDDGASFMDSIAAWLANAGNRITRIFTGEICLTDESGDSECLNKDELRSLKQLLNSSGADTQEDEEPVQEQTDEVVVTPEEPVDEVPEEASAPVETPQ